MCSQWRSIVHLSWESNWIMSQIHKLISQLQLTQTEEIIIQKIINTLNPQSLEQTKKAYLANSSKDQKAVMIPILWAIGGSSIWSMWLNSSSKLSIRGTLLVTMVLQKISETFMETSWVRMKTWMEIQNTIEPQWLKHLWNHENMFETCSSS